MNAIVPLIAVSFVACVGCSPHHADPQRGQTVSYAQLEAINSSHILIELREGRSTNALEELEQRLDWSIVTISDHLSELSPSDRDLAFRCLRRIKAYRDAHPRKQEAISPELDPLSRERDWGSMERASNVLSRLK